MGDVQPLPPYTYVPGGPWPHPISDPRGHSFGRPAARPEPILDGRWQESRAYLHGAALFNAGYYWEAHDVWEGLWHAHGRRGPVADLLKALIKLAAAGVKVREDRPAGVATHARRAAVLLETLQNEVGERYLGLELGPLSAHARRMETEPPRDSAPPGAVAPVFNFQVDPS
jgi:predicted metal-dependent hydrolase